MIYYDKDAAIEITTRFLSQHFSVQGVDAVLEGETWAVTARIEIFGKTMTEKIRIGSKTGRIEDYLLTM